MSQLGELRLPTSIVSQLEVSQLLGQLERFDNELTTISSLDKVGVSSQRQPQPAEQLSDFIELNSLQLESSGQRADLIERLRQLKDHTPVIHLTFAAEADRESLQQLVEWLRASVHPQAVISVGLQPDLVGGVYVRTLNRVHDLSLRARLAGHRHLITQKVEALSGGR